MEAGIPLRHIQAISGHRPLAVLERYLRVTDKQDGTEATRDISPRFLNRLSNKTLTTHWGKTYLKV